MKIKIAIIALLATAVLTAIVGIATSIFRRQQEPLTLEVDSLPDLAQQPQARLLGESRVEPRVLATQGFRTFEADGFSIFAEQIQYPGTNVPKRAPEITGNSQADERIVHIAESRGYRLRPVAEASMQVKSDGKMLSPLAATAWHGLKSAASEDGIQLGLISGYRSVDNQRRIFLNLLRIESQKKLGRTFTSQEIAAGDADSIIDRILSESSVPGYSKHHSGYTIDITDVASGKHFTEFAATAGFRWISAANYQNAKRFGFLPSYPEGADSQGPDPEAWEYVWVGIEPLRDSGQVGKP